MPVKCHIKKKQKNTEPNNIAKFNKLEATVNAETALAGKVLQKVKIPIQYQFSEVKHLNRHNFQSPELPPSSNATFK